MTALREASTLILLTGNNMANQSFEVLIVKRGSEVDYLPNAHVFPGGHFDPVDEHIDWLSIIPPSEQKVRLNVQAPTDAEVPKALSMRLTAIRETFEECGILLCKRYCDIQNSKVIPINLSNSRNWRRKICENPYEFLNLCRTYRCYPDVKSLVLLDVWKSPLGLIRRFDCKFFVAILDYAADGEINNTEVQSIEWKPIIHYIENQDIILPPAQLYELHNLSKFKDIESLNTFLAEVDRSEVETLITISVYASDGLIFLLPGDERYQQLSRYNKNFITVPENIVNYRNSVMRRLEYHPSLRQVVIENYTPKNNKVSSKL